MGAFHIWLLIGSIPLVMSSPIANTRAIVTGGANGLGNAFAHYLLLRGAKRVAILDKDVVNGTIATKKHNDQFGHNRAVFFPTDVTVPDQFEASFMSAVNTLGGLDIMINNAGILDDSKWSLMIDTNVKGVIQGTLMAIDTMGKHKGGEGGTIINIASTDAFEAREYVSGYSASKSAVVSFSRGIALNYERTRVTVKTMCPGGVNTTLVTNPAPRYFQFLDQEEALKWMQEAPLGDSVRVAEELMRLIEDAPNGAIWVTALDSPTLSLNIPEYTQYGTPV